VGNLNAGSKSVNPLSEAINNFYATFGDIDIPKKIEGCEHCLDDKEIEVLLSTPLRDCSRTI
jgi:hypothetical protein